MASWGEANHRSEDALVTTTISEALTGYLTNSGLMESDGANYAQQELHRFGRSLGWERTVDQLAPPEVASYAESVVAAGGDIQGRLSPIKEFLAYLKKHGLSSHSLAPHVKIPRAASRGGPASSSLSSEIIQMTADGHATMVAELDGLKGQRGSIAETIGIARADGDVSDNAPLDAAREHQVNTEGRIRELEEMLRRSEVLSTSAIGKGGAIRIGSKVVLHDEDSGKDTTYTLVDTAEADPTAGKISVASPVGKAIIGHKQGQEVVVQAPKGERRYRVKSIAS